MNLFELSAKISADTKDYEKAVKNATKVSESLKDIMERSATQSETNKNKIKVLASEYSSAKAKVATLTTAFNKAAKEEGITAERTKQLAKELQEAEKESSDLKGQLDELTKKSKHAGDGFSKLGSALGKGLKTAGKIGVAAVGAAFAAIAALTTQAVNSFAEYEQLAGGAQKIFNEMDYSKIATDANNAYKEMGMSANQYLAVINDVGATFAATMGDEAGYEAAKIGLKAIADYASGTGKNMDELSQKFTLITRSTSSYQSIADQFSGILPATSAGFLEQAQAAGLLSKQYTQLTQVPVEEYQAAVSKMLEKGVAELGLANNAMNEAFSTLSGSLSMAKGAWSNLVTGLADDSADLDMLIGNFVESVGAVATQLIPKIGTALNGASELIKQLIPVIVQEIPTIISENLPVIAEAAVGIIQSLVDGISQNQGEVMAAVFGVIEYLSQSFITMLPQIIKLGLNLIVSLANGIAQNLPTLIPTIVDVILQIVNTLTSPDTMTSLIDAAIAIIMGLADGLIAAIPNLIAAIPTIIENLITAIVTNLPKIIEMGITLVINLVTGLIQAIPQLIAAIPQLILAILQGLGSLGAQLAELASNAIAGLLQGLKNAWDAVVGWFTSAWDGLVGGIMDFLGIHSPSRLFAGIGKNMALGLGEGWEDEFGAIQKDINNSMDFEDPSMNIQASMEKISSGTAESANRSGSLGNIVININGAKYEDEQSLAEAVAEAIQSMTDRKAAVYA